MRLPVFLAFAAVVHAAPTPMSNNAWVATRGTAVSDTTVTREGRPSTRVEALPGRDAAVRSAPLTLTIGKRYEVSGWARTLNLEVRDTDRSPIASGAALTMESMPFDVHSESLGGTRDWTRLRLRFTATRAQDSILLTSGNGGSASGKAWFEGVNIDETSGQDEWPAREAVKTFGPAYRYPVGGWIYLHIEGKPYERGYQHGHLMAREIVQYVDRCAAELDSKSRNRAWDLGRTTASALFASGYDQEILAEMKGIADGAADAGAKWGERKIDFIDILAANSITELGELENAIPGTPTGVEGLGFKPPAYFDHKRDVSVTERCSAFAATGPATRDGKMIIGHVTMWPLTLAEQTNVLLDVKPEAGHRVLMQSFPGGIQSGTDWYQNDVGVVLTETTIRQSPFNVRGTPESYRARRAIQYGDNIEQVVEILGAKNNGLYTNEWLIGDAKNNEIAMYELGTYRTKLYRSSKGEWFGGTTGFYWGDNNAKDLDVRLEYAPDPEGQPEHLPYVPAERDLKWQALYQQYKGSIDEQFAFNAFRTAPLVRSTTMDAKVATADMASRMMLWAEFGKPNQREWVPSKWQKEQYEKNDGLYSSGYRMIAAAPSESLRASIDANEKARLAKPPQAQTEKPPKVSYKDRLWKGWVLPATDADTWFTAGSAAYFRDLQSDDLEKAMDAHRAAFRAASLAEPNDLDRFRMEANKGALAFDALRRKLGDDAFFALMTKFFAEHTTKTVSASMLAPTFDFSPEIGAGAIYTPADMHPAGGPIANAILVYGTVLDAGANRYAAEQLQTKLLDWYESAVPIRKDFEVSDDELRTRSIIFVGRPETNSALAAWQTRISLQYDGAVFHIAGAAHASETEGLMWAAPNPLDAKRMVLVLAGNSALETVRLASLPFERAEYTIFESGKQTASGFVKR